MLVPLTPETAFECYKQITEELLVLQYCVK